MIPEPGEASTVLCPKCGKGDRVAKLSDLTWTAEPSLVQRLLPPVRLGSRFSNYNVWLHSAWQDWYYCALDDIVFVPGETSYVPPEKMLWLLDWYYV